MTALWWMEKGGVNLSALSVQCSETQKPDLQVRVEKKFLFWIAVLDPCCNISWVYKKSVYASILFFPHLWIWSSFSGCYFSCLGGFNWCEIHSEIIGMPDAIWQFSHVTNCIGIASHWYWSCSVICRKRGLSCDGNTRCWKYSACY